MLRHLAPPSRDAVRPALVAVAALLAVAIGALAAPTASLAAAPTDDLVRTEVGINSDNPIVTLAPAQTLLSLEPGRRYRLVLLLKNYSEGPVRVEATARDLEAAQSPDSLVRSRSGALTGAGTWLSIGADAFEVGAGEQVELPVLIAVPRNASPGLHAAGVAIARRLVRPSASTDQRTRVTVQASLLAQLLITVSGPAQTRVQLEHPRAPWLVRQGEKPLFEATLANEGNTLVTGTGELAMGTFAGTDAGSYQVRKSLVLPGGRRRLQVRWDDPPWIGWFRPTMIVDANGERLVARYPTVFVLPPWWLVAMLVAALLTPLAVRLRRRRERGDSDIE